MDDKRSSPYNFTSLDSSLIRSTKRSEPARAELPLPRETPAEAPVVDERYRQTPTTGAHAHSPTSEPQARNTITPATMPPRDYATTPPVHLGPVVAEVRKAVKQIGRFEGTHRYTEEEKDGLDEVIRVFRKKRVRTSENEIARIGINFLLEEHRLNGEQSFLTHVLKSLHE